MSQPLRISETDLHAGSGLPVHFLQQHLPALYALVYRLVENVDEAQELTQESFIRALQNPRQAHDLPAVARRLPLIATELSLAYLRRVRPCALAPVSADRGSPEPDPLHALPAGERAVLLLRDEHGVSPADIAKGLHCSTETVRQLLAKARLAVRAALLNQDGERHT